MVDAAADEEDDLAAGSGGHGLDDGGDGVPEVQRVLAGGVWWTVVQAGRREGCGYGIGQGRRRGGQGGGGADELAVQGEERDGVLRVERGVEERGEGRREVVEEALLVAAGVDEDGEADGVVAFHAHLRGLEGRAAVEADVELLAGDGRDWGVVGGERESGDLDEVGVDVEDVR